MIDLILSIFEQGLIYAIMALGVYITYKILDFPDLTVDGSFPLGAAVSTVLLTHGINPYLSLIAAFASGVIAGTLTLSLIHILDTLKHTHNDNRHNLDTGGNITAGPVNA